VDVPCQSNADPAKWYPTWNGPALPASGEYAGHILGDCVQGRNAKMTAELPERGGGNNNDLHLSCSSTQSHVPSRPASSMSVKGHIPACFALSDLHDGAMTQIWACLASVSTYCKVIVHHGRTHCGSSCILLAKCRTVKQTTFQQFGAQINW